MGKGTNYDKKPTMLDALIRAGRLLNHTRDIIKNPKVFDPERDFQGRLLIRIYDTALDVNARAYVANELRADTNPLVAARRLALQAESVASCELLLGLIADTKVAFGIDTHKFWNWARMARETLAGLKAWHESDRRRYGRLAARCGTEKDFSAPGGAAENGAGLDLTDGGRGPSPLGQS